MKINYVTGNQNKYEFAKGILEQFGIEVVQKIPTENIVEIQSHDYLEIGIDKAKKAHHQIGEPLFVTDTSWEIPALNGFPGAYMAYVIKWFTEQDFLNLMKGKSDRSAFAFDNIVYINGEEIKTFQVKLKGEIAETPYGDFTNIWHNILKFDGMYLTDYKKEGKEIEDEIKVWREFADFLKTK